MSIIQDKLGNEFLRSNGSMDSNFGAGMIMFSHLPPVTSFTRLAAHSVMQDFPPQEMMILKKERDSPDCSLSAPGGDMGCMPMGDYLHGAAGIKQEKLTEHDYLLPLYPPGGLRKGTEVLEVTVGNNQNMLMHDLNMGHLPSQLGKEPTGRKGRRSNGDGQEGKPRKKRNEAKQQSMMLDADGGSLSPGNKPHICEHCAASFRSSYHLRRHVLIHTGERPFRCSQCNMSFIQKYLLQRHEKIHSGEKPFCCDQCNMRFIQKYHMERHKRTHSGEKPYRCETCQQYFSRTDRLLKHKRTCGDGIKKELDPGLMDLGCVDMGQGSYGLTQGNPAGGTGRKRSRAKNGEGGERRKKKGADGGGPRAPGLHGAPPAAYGVHDYSAGNHHAAHSSAEPGPSMQQGHHGRAPKMAFKKANRKAGLAKRGPAEQGGGMDGLGLMQGNGAKPGPASSNYDDAMQFLKKRRYLQTAHNASGPGHGGAGGEYDVGVHLSSQPSVIHGVVSGVMDGEAPLSLDKSGIPDEVLQSLLDHYSQKPEGPHADVHFDLGDHHLEMHAAPSGAAASPPGDKTVMMHEYSRFLLQTLERTSHSASFPLGPGPPPAPGPFATPHPGNPLYADKTIYTTSPLECGFGQPAASPSLPTSVPKSHFALLTGSSPQHGFHLSSLEGPAHQQLTPSQELSEQLEKQHAASTPPSSYQISPSDLSGPKEPAVKSGAAVYPPLAPAQDLTPLDSSKPPYQIENFAQAFGAQFKSDGRGLSYGADSGGGEVDHRIRTSVSEFSGFSSLLSDVNEPVSTGCKTPTSQSYR